MSRVKMPQTSIVTRGLAVALGLLLVPMTLTQSGVEENLACGAEGSGGKCILYVGTICEDDDGLLQDRRFAQ